VYVEVEFADPRERQSRRKGVTEAMKRLVLIVVVLAVTATFASAVEVWIQRVEENGRLLVPLRGVFEAAGATVDWHGATQTIEITGGGSAIVMVVDNYRATVNGATVQLDVPPRIVGGSTYIPLRFAGEALGRTVDYKGDRVILASAGAADIVLLIQGEATSGGYVPTPVPTPPTPPTTSAALSITSPRPGARVASRAEVYGTAPGGSMIVVYTEVRSQADNHVLKDVPGLRHSVPANGNWHVAVAIPVLPENISEPLYYIIKAYYETPGYQSPEVSVRVTR